MFFSKRYISHSCNFVINEPQVSIKPPDRTVISNFSLGSKHLLDQNGFAGENFAPVWFHGLFLSNQLFCLNVRDEKKLRTNSAILLEWLRKNSFIQLIINVLLCK